MNSLTVVSVLLGMLTVAAALALFGAATHGEELIGGAITGGILGYLVAIAGGALLDARRHNARTLRRAATVYAFIAMAVFGTLLAIADRHCTDTSGCLAELAAAPARALLWPVYIAFAILPPTIAFAVFVVSAIVLAILMLLAWDRYVAPVLAAQERRGGERAIEET